jgi:predicted unusual protein kinase regulating ubiquinone biosynthesis (AarF/ABC1/UbiB family)
LCLWRAGEWDGRAVTDLAIKFTEEAVSAEEVGNLKACQRYTYGPNIDCKGGMSAIVMHKGQGTVLDSVAGWKANKQALLPIIAQQTAAMAVDWMHKYGRMHTDLHPGNVSCQSVRVGDYGR